MADNDPSCPFAKLKVVELKEQLAAKGLPTTGLKRELVTRLEEACAAAAADSTVSPDEDVTTVNTEKTSSERKIGETGEIANEQDISMEKGNIAGEKSTVNNNDTDEQPMQIDSKRTTSSSIIKITNLTRPFTTQSLRSLLSRYGAVITLWLDQLRTTTFIEYDSIQGAELCKLHLDGIKWPEGIGKPLIVELSSAELMNAAMNAPVVERTLQVPTTNANPKATLDELFRKTRTQPALYYLPKHQ